MGTRRCSRPLSFVSQSVHVYPCRNPDPYARLPDARAYADTHPNYRPDAGAYASADVPANTSRPHALPHAGDDGNAAPGPTFTHAVESVRCGPAVLPPDARLRPGASGLPDDDALRQDRNRSANYVRAGAAMSCSHYDCQSLSNVTSGWPCLRKPAPAPPPSGEMTRSDGLTEDDLKPLSEDDLARFEQNMRVASDGGDLWSDEYGFAASLCREVRALRARIDKLHDQRHAEARKCDALRAALDAKTQECERLFSLAADRESASIEKARADAAIAERDALAAGLRLIADGVHADLNDAVCQRLALRTLKGKP